MSSFLLADQLHDEKKPIKVYARVRPLNDEEVERGDETSVETFDDGKRIKIIDEKHSQETTYYFDGVFRGTDSNEKVFVHTTQHLLMKLLNGINCALLTYGQTGSGKTYTLMADGCITDYAVQELFEKIEQDRLHKYQITCSFVQVYQEKVYDLLSPDSKELPVREHPKRGVYVSNLTHHRANTEDEVFRLFNKGRRELVTAETRMVRHSSRSHSIFQLSIERRLDTTQGRFAANNAEETYIFGSKQPEEHDGIMLLEEDMVIRGKMDICDLAGSERLGKSMVEGIHLSEARHINSSLLELGNVIYALSEGKRRHIPFRNSTLTRLLQECLGSRCQTSFIVCVAPSTSEAYETRCSLNFGTRARTITNKERMSLNVEFDYKVLAKKLTKRIEILELELLAARPIQDFISSSLNALNVATETQTDFSENTEELFPPDNPCVLADVKHALDVSEMLESLLENCENIHQHVGGYETLLSSSTMSFFTMVITAISHTHNALLSSACANDVSEVVDQSLQKMTKIKSEMQYIRKHDKKDLFTETAYMISELCTDVENVLAKVVHDGSDTSEGVTHRSVYKIMNQAFETVGVAEDPNILSSVRHLLNILQVLQITRILLESSRSLLIDNAKPKKSFTWSTSIEEVASDAENTFSLSSNEDAYFSDFSSITGTLRFEQIRAEQLRKENDFLKKQQVERMLKSDQISLNRSHSFKMKGELLWRESSGKSVDNSECDSSDQFSPVHRNIINAPNTRLSRRRSKVQSLDYPRTQTKKFVYIEDGSSKSLCSDAPTDVNYLKIELADLERRYGELSVKYKKLVEEKANLTEKLAKVHEGKMTLTTERDYARRQIQRLLEHRAEETDAIDHMQDEYSKLHDTLYLKHEENVENVHTVVKLETKVREKDLIIRDLEGEQVKLKTERDALANEKKCITHELSETRGEVEKYESKQRKIGEDARLFATEIISICGPLDMLKDHEVQRRNPSSAEDISSLESELYKITEQLVRYEVAIKEIRLKSSVLLSSNCNGAVEEQESVDDDDQVKMSRKNITAKVVSQRAPVHITKKINAIKKAQKKLVNDVRQSYSDQPISAAKEIKICRASRLKELIQEKIEMAENMSSLEKEISVKDSQLKERQKQIDLLVQELATLDFEINEKTEGITITREKATLSASRRPLGKKSIDITLPVGDDEEIEIIEIPEIKYADLVQISNQRLNKKPKETSVPSTACNTPNSGITSPEASAEPPFLNQDEEEMVPIRELELLRHELDMCRQQKSQLQVKYETLLESGENTELLNENASLIRKIEYLGESNSALVDENRLIKITSQERKNKLQELRDKNNKNVHEIEQMRRQSLQLQARSDSVRQKLERRLAKMKEKVMALEKYSEKLEEDLHVVKKELKLSKSFDDSGLVQDDDYITE